MYVEAYLRHGLRLLLPLAIASTIYLYLYPFFGSCAFPVESKSATEAFELTKQLHWPYAGGKEALDQLPTRLAPFRLLALGDPQLEGDTSIPIQVFGFMPHVKSLFEHVTFQTEHWSFRWRVRQIMHDAVDIVIEDIPYIAESLRKHIDLFGNDFYLAHIYRTVRWWTRPTHVTVLGDLLGSQWIDDEEFERRARRFWKRSFKGGERLPDELAAYPVEKYNITGYLDGSIEQGIWTKRILNVAGNHDIGYAGDLTIERMDRFEKAFGKANYELRFELPGGGPDGYSVTGGGEKTVQAGKIPPQLRIIVVNDMNLDTPAKEPKLQDDTYQFINAAISNSPAVENKGHFTLVLTHIPLFKPEGVCVDAPFFEFHPAEEGGGIKEQYLLSNDASRGFLEGIYGVNADTTVAGEGRGRQGLILNGHDHEGCDTFHFVNQTNGTSGADRPWEVRRWAEAVAEGIPGKEGHPGRREITVRSMMGDFGGNAGLLSLWFDRDAWEWKYEFANCALGTQHFWWTVHSLDFAVLVFSLVYAIVGRLVTKGVDVDRWMLDNVVKPVKRWVEVVMDTRIEVKIVSVSQRRKEVEKTTEEERRKKAAQGNGKRK